VIYRIYSITEGIPAALLSEIFLVTDTYQLTHEPATADFFAYPTHYQVAYDYTDADFAQHGLAAGIQPLIQQRFAALDALAAQYQKKIITVYIRDNAKPLPSEQVIVFRTSLTASNRQRHEFAFPANGRPLHTPSNTYPNYLPWHTKPSVGFRGQAAPMQLPWNEAWRNTFNLLAQKMNWQKQFPIQYNFGYLHRRNALLYLQKNKHMALDARITTAADIFDTAARMAYADNLLQHPYALCVSGHGNYSFRLYETMAAGRIPLFVNTDCVLPLQELIDYKNLFVWVEANALHHIAARLQQYHAQHQGAAFENKQQQIQQTWQQYLAGLQYYRHLPYYLKHFTAS
jgi:hypothetical protein